MTVGAKADTLKKWDIGEDDFGGVMIFHRHADHGVPAYVVGEVDERIVAECSDCRKVVEFAPATRSTH